MVSLTISFVGTMRTLNSEDANGGFPYLLKMFRELILGCPTDLLLLGLGMFCTFPAMSLPLSLSPLSPAVSLSRPLSLAAALSLALFPLSLAAIFSLALLYFYLPLTQ